MPDALRVLLIAEACNPEWTSVPLVGWSHSQAIRALTDAHLVTQVRNREPLIHAGLVEGRDFTAIDSEAVIRPLRRLSEWLGAGGGRGWTALTAAGAMGYYYFEYLLWKRFAARIKAHEFDVVHRITPLSPTVPSLLAKKCTKAGVPFVLGPLNGGVPWPKGFDGARRQEREWLSYLRGAYKLLPGYASTRKHAAAILIGSRDTWRQMPAQYHSKCIYMPENAVDTARFSLRRTRTAGQPLRAVFVGRLVPYKGADMLLEAAPPLLRAGALTLEVIGDGPQLPRLQEIVHREQIGECVNLAGWVPHERVQERLVASDVLAFPSIREFGGGVVLEAMAVGVPPIVMAYGGPGELVTPETGFLLPMGPREQIVAELRRVLAELCAHPEAVDARSEPARQRVLEQFTWQAKARQVLAVYERLIRPSSRNERAAGGAITLSAGAEHPPLHVTGEGSRN